jgi:Hypothetical glycosyl hydrolase family 15
MLVSTPWGARASVSTLRQLALLLVALLTCAVLVLPSTAGAAPKILKKATVVAPQGGTVRGTLTGSKCLVRLPVNGTKIKVTVTGPLSVKRPKTKTLKAKGRKKVICTWKTTAFVDGNYRLTATARLKVSGRVYKVTLKRSVVVRNKVSAPMVSGTGALAEGPQLGVGNARFAARLLETWDGWLTGIDATRKAFARQHWWNVVSYSPSFDRHLEWAPPTLVYKDLYAIGRDDMATQNAHPEWVLRDVNGKRLYIDWGCQPGPCPQVAGDIGSPTFRANWIADAKAAVSKGYAGIWIDDANMEIRVGDETGAPAIPVDPRTGKPMTFANWRKYIAEFLEQIRREIPQTQLVANILWFGGTSIGRDSDPYIRRAYTAVDRLNLERGFNDEGLTAGYAPRDVWAVETFMLFIDRMHDLGIPVTLDSGNPTRDAWEYNLGGFFLVDRGADALGEMFLPAGQWWNGWDVRIGSPLGERERRPDGIFERKFQRGYVLLNPSKAATKTVKLGRAWKRIDGTTVTSVTLAGGRAAVLLAP